MEASQLSRCPGRDLATTTSHGSECREHTGIEQILATDMNPDLHRAQRLVSEVGR